MANKDFHQDRKAEQLDVIDVEKVVNGTDYANKASVREALLGRYAFTGCDTTSAFHCLGKMKALEAMLKHDRVETFRLLGQE